MRIIQITNSVFESNTYLIVHEDQKACYLIDCGDINPVLNSINEWGLSLKGIFITHSHFDHIYGLNSIIEKYSEVFVYTSTFGARGLQSDKLNLSRYDLQPFAFQYINNIKILNEHSLVSLFEDVELEVIETPGHDKSCLTYKIGKSLFTGDSFIPGVKTIASFPNSNKTEAESSKLRILSLSKDSNLYPGHGVTYTKFQPEKYR